MPYPYPPTEEKPPLEEPKEAEVSPLFQALLKEEEKELDLSWEWIKEIGVEDDPDIEEEVREWLGK